MYTIEDIDIFIITHNRAEYLDRVLESLSKQSVNISDTKVKVLCNDCIDNTKSIIEKFSFAQYIPTTGTYGNYNKAIEIVNKEYFVLLHDDDIIHPQYFERMLNILNFSAVKPALLGGGYINFYDENEISKKYAKQLGSKYYITLDNKSFAKLTLSNFCRFSYASAIFKTEFYKKFDNIKFMDKYGRLADFFIMAEMLKYGSAAILRDNNAYFHRLHKNSDTKSKKTLISNNQFDNVVKEFAYLTDNFKGFTTCRIWEMFEEYYQHTNNSLPYKEYLLKNTNIPLRSYSKIYFERHKNIINYIKYLILIKCHKKIRNQIKNSAAKEVIKGSVSIEFN